VIKKKDACTYVYRCRETDTGRVERKLIGNVRIIRAKVKGTIAHIQSNYPALLGKIGDCSAQHSARLRRRRLSTASSLTFPKPLLRFVSTADVCSFLTFLLFDARKSFSLCRCRFNYSAIIVRLLAFLKPFASGFRNTSIIRGVTGCNSSSSSSRRRSARNRFRRQSSGKATAVVQSSCAMVSRRGQGPRQVLERN